MKIPRAPNGLKTNGKRFWKQVLKNDFEFVEAHDLERFFQACRCLDEISEDEKIVESEGRYILDRFKQKREHPAAKAIRDNKILFCRIIRELGLDLEVGPDPRPRRRY